MRDRSGESDSSTGLSRIDDELPASQTGSSVVDVEEVAKQTVVDVQQSIKLTGLSVVEVEVCAKSAEIFVEVDRSIILTGFSEVDVDVSFKIDFLEATFCDMIGVFAVSGAGTQVPLTADIVRRSSFLRLTKSA